MCEPSGETEGPNEQAGVIEIVPYHDFVPREPHRPLMTLDGWGYADRTPP